ncbi:MAG: hypothetical protein GKR99_03960 [Rhodobacteraceae bacterium]|nr:hypothetical protein [Paracoccaceae bacterium]
MKKIIVCAILAAGGYMVANGGLSGGKSAFQMSSQKSSGGFSGLAKSSGAAIGGTIAASGNIGN